MTTDETIERIRHALAEFGVTFIPVDDSGTMDICDAAIAEDLANWADVISTWISLTEEAR